MFEKVSEYDYYMQHETDFGNAPAGVLAVISPGNEGDVIRTELETIGESVDMPIFVIDSEEMEYLDEDLRLSGSTTVILFKGGVEYHRFEDDIDINIMKNWIMELDNSMMSMS